MMIFTRNDIIKKYPWINKKKQRFIISADYDGLICASLLNHHKQWNLVGYYDLESIWISDEAKKNKNDIIWVDLNILPHQGRAIGGHIISIADESLPGFETSCNPNILAELNSSMFKKKFPLSTLLFLLWIYNIEIPKKILSKMLVLHSDSSWLKAQNYNKNFTQLLYSSVFPSRTIILFKPFLISIKYLQSAAAYSNCCSVISVIKSLFQSDDPYFLSSFFPINSNTRSLRP